MLAALAIQGVGPVALFLMALFGGAFSNRTGSAEPAGLSWRAWAGGAV